MSAPVFTNRFSLAIGLVALVGSLSDVAAKEPAASGSKPAAEAKMNTIPLARGAMTIEAPAAWEKVKPRNRIIEVELAVTAKAASAEGSDKKPGSDKKGSDTKTAAKARLTMMAAGGSVDQNLNRWVGQFQGTAAGAAREKGKIEHREVAGMKLHTLDIAGTYMDSMRGPFGPKVPKENHRMLAGILETEGNGKYFFKFIGPTDIVTANEKAFANMLDSVEMKK